jgi:hypothetical protein
VQSQPIDEVVPLSQDQLRRILALVSTSDIT